MCISVLILVCHGSLYYIYCFLAVAEAKWHAATVIHTDDATENYLRVNSSSVVDPDADELWYRGKLYDVAKRELVHDTLYLYLYRDREEEDLTTDCGDFIRNETGLSGTWSFEAGHKNSSLNLPNFKYILPDVQRLSWSDQSLKKEYPDQSFLLASVVAEVLIPPPKS